MLLNIHFSKALILVCIILLISIYTFNKIIQNHRLEVFREYTGVLLPPVYEVKQNTAGAGNSKTDVLLVFGFDEKNFQMFLRLNKINLVADSSLERNFWESKERLYFKKRILDNNSTITETVDTRNKTLEFQYQEK